ncbi:hypothetical protein [Pseudoalteromonas ruthenica]|uniref:hypothetical protein n=1 Tax=Pseudoalteromonas ruthenica TaxID=151081 RepID=UPI00110B13ED|nr:hypothetical protein [Pseudoalteromonas ruthenica]TMO44281.1 hypothetical protein CWC24_14235 [Pseudoalteromonas ruthenica]TMO51478.1 hypothetical protein CWC23_05995 [Pseudoalteromonas ruthenica]
MRALGGQLISSPRIEFFTWLSTGVAATSLALLIFIPSLNEVNEYAKIVSLIAFIVSLTFSVGSLSILKEMIVFSNASNDKATSIHHFVLFVALLSYLIGFGAYFYSLSPIYTYIFTGAFVVVLIFFKKAQNAIIAPNKKIDQSK